ncbi:MAG: hypothetical protein GY773_22055 [Actinomycetia bacterium]|nr:hypothetical protein [Actinomycetes bacterium]
MDEGVVVVVVVVFVVELVLVLVASVGDEAVADGRVADDEVGTSAWLVVGPVGVGLGPVDVRVGGAAVTGLLLVGELDSRVLPVSPDVVVSLSVPALEAGWVAGVDGLVVMVVEAERSAGLMEPT